jgi:hypothetical protein
VPVCVGLALREADCDGSAEAVPLRVGVPLREGELLGVGVPESVDDGDTELVAVAA